MGILGTQYFFDKALPALIEVLKLPVNESAPILLKALGCAIIISIIIAIITIISMICDQCLAHKLSITKEKLDNIYTFIIVGVPLFFAVLILIGGVCIGR